MANRLSLLYLLSLVWFGLTRQSFEPLGKISWRLLTFKTVFLLTLALGKGRRVFSLALSSLTLNEYCSQVALAIY